MYVALHRGRLCRSTPVTSVGLRACLPAFLCAQVIAQAPSIPRAYYGRAEAFMLTDRVDLALCVRWDARDVTGRLQLTWVRLCGAQEGL